MYNEKKMVASENCFRLFRLVGDKPNFTLPKKGENERIHMHMVTKIPWTSVKMEGTSRLEPSYFRGVIGKAKSSQESLMTRQTNVQ